MEIFCVFNDPTAGAFADELAHGQDGIRNNLSNEFGGGTFEVAILEVQEKVLSVILRRRGYSWSQLGLESHCVSTRYSSLYSRVS